MLTIITLLGHSLENFSRLVDELSSHVDAWVVVKHPSVQIDDARLTIYNEVLSNHWDAGLLRTQALVAIKEGWVLHLDSDEWFTQHQIRALRTYADRLPLEVDCVCLPRRNIEPDKDWEGWPDQRPMLHRADRGIFWTRRTEEWPQGCKKMILSPVTSDFTIMQVHVYHQARMQAQHCRDDAKLAQP